MVSNIRRAAGESRPDPAPRFEPAVVTTVTAAGAADGNNLCTLTWNGELIDAAYLASYTPVVGHTVLVVFQPPSSVTVLGRLIGTPPTV